MFYETRELHKKLEFRTRWYQGTYENVKEAIFLAAEELGYYVIDVNDAFKEMLLEGRHTVVVKVTSYNKYELGVDFNISNRWILDFGRGKKIVNSLYEHIGRHAKYKGVSLHP